MDFDVETLAAAMLRLPTADRAALVARLLDSLDEDAAERAAYDAAWEAELDRREAADPAEDLDADEALATLAAELAAEQPVQPGARR